MIKRKRNDDRYPRYVPVEERIAILQKEIRKSKREGKILQPVVLEGKTIAKTFWGKAWCDNIESYQDYENRLPRGRTYVRRGAVIDLQISPGKVRALVAGSRSEPYEVNIFITPINLSCWQCIRQQCVGKISSMLELLKGNLPEEILKLFCNQETGLFPKPSEIEMSCSCPDWSSLCKHIAAVLYGIGNRLDENPKLFFILRCIPDDDLKSLVSAELLTGNTSSELDETKLDDVFGISLDTLEDVSAEQSVALPVLTPEPSVKIPENETARTVSDDAKTITRTKKTATRTAKTVPEKTTQAVGMTQTLPAKTRSKKTVCTLETVTVELVLKRLKISRRELAEALGTYYQRVYAWEKQLCRIPEDIRMRMMKLLGE